MYINFLINRFYNLLFFNVLSAFLDGEKAVMNGDCHSEPPEDDQRNVIKIKGKQEDCEAAKQALLVGFEKKSISL